MSKNNFEYQGTISRNYIKKVILKNTIGYLFIYASWFIFTFLILYILGVQPFDWFLWEIFYSVIIPYLVLLFFLIFYLIAYVKMFSFKISESNLVIQHGIFTKKRSSHRQ